MHRDLIPNDPLVVGLDLVPPVRSVQYLGIHLILIYTDTRHTHDLQLFRGSVQICSISQSVSRSIKTHCVVDDAVAELRQCYTS